MAVEGATAAVVHLLDTVIVARVRALLVATPARRIVAATATAIATGAMIVTAATATTVTTATTVEW